MQIANQRRIYIIGNPNSGKSTLFNRLTGMEQKTANYPGVTTEKKIGYLINQPNIELLDLPGCYSLYPNSMDERVVLSELLNQSPDLIIFVADASNLSRSLMFYTQIADLKFPTIVVVNMIDELEKLGYEIEWPLLSQELGVPTFRCNSKSGEGIRPLIDYLLNSSYLLSDKSYGRKSLFDEAMTRDSFSYIEWHRFVASTSDNAIIATTKRNEIIDRYNQVEQILNLSMRKTKKAIEIKKISDKIDDWVMHPIFGWVVMFMVLYIVFQTLFWVAQFPMDWLDLSFGYLSSFVQSRMPEGTLTDFLVEAIIPGVSGVLIFIPQIALLFMLNTILEESGYLARMVFLVDRLMRIFGMSGKGLLPLLSGNACAIPAIASTKTIPTQRERLITILAIPFMTCSARLPVYTLLTSIVVPLQYRGISILAMYALGLISAMSFAWIIKYWIRTDEKSFLIMEIPPYRRPTLRNLVVSIRNAVLSFVKVAGKFIVSISVILWFMSSYGWQDGRLQKVNLNSSFAGHLGRAIEPAIEPLGYDWKIGVSLITSFAAREVFVSSLNTLYNIENEDDTQSLIQTMSHQINPKTGLPVFTLATSISLLLFYAFALQCMSTLAAIVKETNSYFWAALSFVLMSSIAYISAFIAYQILS